MFDEFETDLGVQGLCLMSICRSDISDTMNLTSLFQKHLFMKISLKNENLTGFWANVCVHIRCIASCKCNYWSAILCASFKDGQLHVNLTEKDRMTRSTSYIKPQNCPKCPPYLRAPWRARSRIFLQTKPVEDNFLNVIIDLGVQGLCLIECKKIVIKEIYIYIFWCFF